jgi:hypothetical protein
MTLTPLWRTFPFSKVKEQVIYVSIDNSSVFLPGGNNPQHGFRRSDIIAEVDGSPDNLIPTMEVGTTVFHFSIKASVERPLNYNHEYQIVFVEFSDGSHVFGIQLGTPLSPDPNAETVLDHGLDILFETPFLPAVWHNFAVQVDWEARTLGVFYSLEGLHLVAVTHFVKNKANQRAMPERENFISVF